MKFGFRSKIYLGMLSLLLLLGLVIIFTVSRIMTNALLEENRNRGISMGTNLAARLIDPVLAMDFFRMKTLLDETVRSGDDISYAFFLDDRKEPLVHTFKGGFPVDLERANEVGDQEKYRVRLLDTGKARIYDYAVPVLIGNDRLGTARLGLQRIRVREAVRHLMWSTFLITGVVILIAGFIGTVLARTVTRPIKVLHQSTEAALRGNLDVKTAPLLKRNCWEIMQCGKSECPAFGDVRHRCWYLAGTLCPSCVEGEYAKRMETCLHCSVYRRCSGDEIQSLAESFDSMTLSVKSHLSELKNTEKILTAQRRLLKTILDATPDFVSLQDCRYVYQVVNKAFCEIMKKKEEDIVGKTDLDLFSDHRAKIHRLEDRRILETGEPLIKRDSFKGPQGRRWVHVVKIPVRDVDGKVVGLLCSSRDITEFKRVQEKLAQSQKMESVGRLVAGVAHEINTPLGIILGYVQLLIEEIEPGTQNHLDLLTVEKQAKICRKIVSDLLRFSRHTESMMAPLDVRESIEEVLAVVEHAYGLDRVSIVRRFAPELPMIVGDKDKIKQAVINLVNNAFDAIFEEGVITVGAEYDPASAAVVITVADTGTGIPPEQIDRIFDPFFTTKPVDKGTGLGLSVTFGIIREHGGEIEVESPPPRERSVAEGAFSGTRFTIHLPAADQAGKMETEDGKNISSG